MATMLRKTIATAIAIPTGPATLRGRGELSTQLGRTHSAHFEPFRAFSVTELPCDLTYPRVPWVQAGRHEGELGLQSVQ
jgi:hypothetical protein